MRINRDISSLSLDLISFPVSTFLILSQEYGQCTMEMIVIRRRGSLFTPTMTLVRRIGLLHRIDAFNLQLVDAGDLPAGLLDVHMECADHTDQPAVIGDRSFDGFGLDKVLDLRRA